MKNWYPFLGLAALLAGCNSIVVKKAQLQSIRSVAVVSWFASQRVPEVRGQGVFRKADGELRMQVAEDALRATMDELESLGWEVAPPEEVIQKEAFKKAFNFSPYSPLPGQSANAFRRHFFAPTEMFPLWIGDQGAISKGPSRRLSKSDKEVLADLLHQLRLDAALLFKVQYCFRTFERDKQERVIATAVSGIQIVDRKAKLIYETPLPEGCGMERGESVSSMDIDGEDWVYDPMKREAIRKLFREASQAEAARLLASLPVTPRPKKEQP